MQSSPEIRKTYKFYIGGAFERSESGLTQAVYDSSGHFLANAGTTSRKDVRNAVTSSKSAVSKWAGKSAYNRGQILYRIAEMLSRRSAEIQAELVLQGWTEDEALADTEHSIAIWVAYAGWTDKYQAVFGSVNPVASSHFNFSVHEPVGTVVIDASKAHGLSGLSALIAPVLCGGNTCVAIIPDNAILACLAFAEILHTSDVPHGTINLLNSISDEVREHIAAHRDIPSVAFTDIPVDQQIRLQELAASNLKRLRFVSCDELSGFSTSDPYEILAYQEVKTTWHPVGL